MDLSPEVDLFSCQKALEKTFRKGDLTPRLYNSFSRMTLDLLEQDEMYNQWISTSHSALFLVSGRTKPESRDGHNTCSWLSNAGVNVAEKLQADGNFTLFYSCHPNLRADDFVPWQAPLSALIYQALTHRPEVLRYDNQRLQSLVDQWQKESCEQKKLSMMIQTLRKCLANATVGPQKPMYIVLDRADICDGSKALKRHFLKELVGLVSDNSLCVKVILVLDSTLWEGLEDFFDDWKGEAKGRLLGKLGWNQREHAPHLPSPEWL